MCGYGGDRTTTHNFQRKRTINLHHTRASIEAVRYEIYNIRITIITIIMNNARRINITVKHNDDDGGHEIVHYIGYNTFHDFIFTAHHYIYLYDFRNIFKVFTTRVL